MENGELFCFRTMLCYFCQYFAVLRPRVIAGLLRPQNLKSLVPGKCCFIVTRQFLDQSLKFSPNYPTRPIIRRDAVDTIEDSAQKFKEDN